MLRSLRLGLYGKADVVEFRPAPADPAPGDPPSPPGSADPADPADVSPVSSVPPGTVPFPVEYKRGKPKKNRCDEVQLCAQALCLEEMLGVPVPAGAIFYGTTRRRTDVAFDGGLRALTLRLIGELREIVDEGRTPAAAWEKKCERCSLIRLCLPEARPGTDAAGRYLKRAVGQALAAAGGPAGE
jgi:CRISPR-associated exonuclease Cas4